MVTPLAKAIGHDRGKQHEFYEEYLELYDEARKATNFKEEFDEFFEQKVEYEDIKSVRWLKQEIKFLNHVISYSKVRRKMIFIPLTVDGMRDYYRKKTKKFDLIPVYFSSNDYVNLFGPVGMNSSYKEGEKLEFREFFYRCLLSYGNTYQKYQWEGRIFSWLVQVKQDRALYRRRT